MFVEQILYPIETLGPGKRIAVWTAGCTKHCFNCANPELWDAQNKSRIDVKDVAQIIHNICRENVVDGITFTGGDPLEQAEEMILLLKLIKSDINDVLVYTGYQYSELCLLLEEKKLIDLKKYITVLIDGPYIDEMNDNSCSLRGSLNQEIIYFDKTYQHCYEKYLSKGRKIQNVMLGNRLISVGIHNK